MALSPDSGRLLLATGAIVIWWGRIEGLLFRENMAMRRHPIISEGHASEPLHIATKQLINQWAKWTSIVMAHDDEALAAISTTKSELIEISEDRHILVHGFWDYPIHDRSDDQSNITVIKPNKKGEIIFRKFEVDYKSLVEIHDKLASIYHRLLGFDTTPFLLAQIPKAQKDDAEAK